VIRILPDMAKAKAHWERRSSEIPDYLMVPMSDRTVVKYVPEIKQPKPVLKGKLDKFTQICVGYERMEE